MKKTVYFDLDGVLARFTCAAAAAHGRASETHAWTTWNHQRSWGLTDEQFYAPMGRDFWANVPVFTDGFALLDAVAKKFGTDRLLFLSSPVRTPGCEEGKRVWFKKHLSVFDPWADLMLGGAKHKVAHAGSVLIDDSDDNIAKFIAAGGLGFLVPRPWNLARDRCYDDGLFNVNDETMNLLEILEGKL